MPLAFETWTDERTIHMKSHGKCWLVANGDDGNRYWCYCDAYDDEKEKNFKRQVYSRSGYDCRKVHRESHEPDRGFELFV